LAVESAKSPTEFYTKQHADRASAQHATAGVILRDQVHELTQLSRYASGSIGSVVYGDAAS